MIFARTSKAASRLSEQIREKVFKKKYLAVVDGKFENKEGTLEDYLYKDERNNISKVVNKDKKNAKLAKLEYEVLDYDERINLSKNIEFLSRKISVVVTDRVEKSNPPYLINVSIYKCQNMSKNTINEYYHKYYQDEKDLENIDNYFNEDADWIIDDNVFVTPLFLNNLLSLIVSGKKPTDYVEATLMHLEHLLEREQYEKKETRIKLIKHMLTSLTYSMKELKTCSAYSIILWYILYQVLT